MRRQPSRDRLHRAVDEPAVISDSTAKTSRNVARRPWQRPALRTDEEFEQSRAVSWLELFFDLVFVVVIARLAHHLADHVDVEGVVMFGLQFIAVFWMWNAFTYYTERFETDDGLEGRLFTFLAIVPVAGLAVYGEQGLGATYVGFASSYLLARAVNQVGWIRAAVHVTAFRPVAARFVGGYALVTAIILASFAATEGARVVLFGVAIAVEIAIPYFTLNQQAVLPRLSTSKFPERFGLFTMIVLGESVVGVIVGLSELQDRGVLDGPGIVAGVLGLAVGFALWWIYFDFVARRAPKPVLVMALLWVYLHAAALTAITATGVGVSVAIADTATGSLTDPSRYLLVGSVVLGLVGVAALQTTLTRGEDEPTHARLSPGLKLAVAAVIGTLGVLDLGWGTHALLVALLAGLAVPMTYGAFVWFTQPVTEPASDAVEG